MVKFPGTLLCWVGDLIDNNGGNGFVLRPLTGQEETREQFLPASVGKVPVIEEYLLIQD